MLTSEKVGELAKALAAAQAKIKNPEFDSDNPYYKSRYASLASVRDTITPALAENGVAVIQSLDFKDDVASCSTRLIHSSGEWLDTGPFSAPVRPRKEGASVNAQDVCAASTYLRRYSLQAAVNVVGDHDDDGTAASGLSPAQGNVGAPAKPYKPAYKKAGAPDPIGPVGEVPDHSTPSPVAADSAGGGASVAVGFLNNLEAASTEAQVDSIVKGIVLIAAKISEADKVKLRAAADAARLRIKAKPYVPPTAAQLMSELLGLKSQLGEGMFNQLLKKHMGDPEASNFALGTDGLRNVRDEALKAIGP